MLKWEYMSILSIDPGWQLQCDTVLIEPVKDALLQSIPELATEPKSLVIGEWFINIYSGVALNRLLNALGLLGWEAVSSTGRPSSWHILFKRPVTKE